MINNENSILAQDLNRTKLHQAAYVGNYELVQELLQNGENPNVKDACNVLPIAEAARYGYFDIFKLLYNHNSNITQKDTFGETPLIRAIIKNRIDIVKYIVENNIKNINNIINNFKELNKYLKKDNEDVTNYLTQLSLPWKTKNMIIMPDFIKKRAFTFILCLKRKGLCYDEICLICEKACFI
jgi:ankyrin repeat protein